MLNPNEQYSIQRLTASGLIRSGNGQLGGFLVAQGTPTVTIYDNTAASGTILLNAMVCAAGTSYPLPVALTIGAYAVISGACDISFFYN